MTEPNPYLALAHLALLIAAAKALGEVVARLRFPSVLGEIVAGIILGPSLLGLVKPDHTLRTFATAGIILLLFIAGLEIDLDIMKGVGIPSLVVALFGVAVPMAAGTLTFLALGDGFHYAVFTGAIMTATSIGLTLRTLMDLGRFRTPAGITIVTAAVIDDVIGIFILAVLVSMETGGRAPGALYVLKLLGLVVLFFSSTIGIGWWLAKYLTGWISKMWVEEALLAFAICAAVTLGWLASSFRVAEITGAFTAGLVLNRTRERRVILEKVNEGGYGFFIPVFFAYIGVSTELGALAKAGALTFVFAGIAIVGKIVGCGLAARIWFDTKKSIAIGVGMIPRAEVALIMATMGLGAGVIDQRVFVMTVSMVFLTNILTPVLLKFSFKQADKGERPGEECKPTPAARG